MSLYPAVDMLRRLAKQYREREHGVTGAQLLAARQALSIIAAPVLAALQCEQAANVLDWAAGVLERAARAEETPGPDATPRPKG